jgi:hypothetical protein
MQDLSVAILLNVRGEGLNSARHAVRRKRESPRALGALSGLPRTDHRETEVMKGNRGCFATFLMTPDSVMAEKGQPPILRGVDRALHY